MIVAGCLWHGRDPVPCRFARVGFSRRYLKASFAQAAHGGASCMILPAQLPADSSSFGTVLATQHPDQAIFFGALSRLKFWLHPCPRLIGFDYRHAALPG